jgi:nicotinamide riboside kinase
MYRGGARARGAAMDLEGLLLRVANGETEFQADGETPEARQEFAQTVDAACQAFMRGYIASLDTRWGERMGRRCTEAVYARQLTEKGRRFLEKMQAQGLPVRV